MGTRQHYVLDIVTEYFNVNLETILEGMADSQVHIELSK